MGDLAVELFFDNAQAVWPCLAPFVDSRSLATAEEVGIGGNVDAMFAEVGRDPVEMCRLARGLSVVRLDKRQRELQGGS